MASFILIHMQLIILSPEVITVITLHINQPKDDSD